MSGRFARESFLITVRLDRLVGMRAWWKDLPVRRSRVCTVLATSNLTSFASISIPLQKLLIFGVDFSSLFDSPDLVRTLSTV